MNAIIGLGLFLVVLFVLNRLIVQRRKKHATKQQDTKHTDIKR